MKVVAYVERGKGRGNFSCYVPETVNGCGLGGYGKTAREAMDDTMVCLEEYKEMAAEKGETFPDVDFDFRFDVGAFFNYYPIDVTAFARYVGMNPSVMRQYATAIRQPKEAQMQKIREGINRISRDLGANLIFEQAAVPNVD